MKKRLLSVILASVCMLSLVACGDTQNQTNENETVEVSEEVSETVEESEEPIEEGDPEDMWLLRTNWGETAENIDGKLFHPDAKFPLTPENMDVFCGPYTYVVKNDHTNVESMQDVIVLDTMLEPRNRFSDVAVVFNNIYDEEAPGLGSVNDDLSNGLGEMYIVNLTDTEEEIPASTCYENGWWYAQSYVATNNILPAIYQVQNPDEFNAYANAIVTNLGAPTYIAPTDDYKDGSEDDFYAAMETENTMEYYLVYEYEEFTILIYITDHARNKADEGVEVGKVQYLTAEYWNVIKEEGYTLFQLR
ncbi:MAG: hypothetical protein IJ336_11095 [Lachnospiraceae bacterium]|nr:hypothetical protein [Lachnospiraceae bacterium]